MPTASATFVTSTLDEASVARRLADLVDQGLLSADPVQLDIASQLDGVRLDLESAETDRGLASKT
ncbi:MAG: hypothetical protein AAF737_04245, partial [Pseudomonadota bacterium]